MLMIHDPPKMGFNFESVRTEDEKMTMLTTVKISEVLSFLLIKDIETLERKHQFLTTRPVQSMYLQKKHFSSVCALKIREQF